MTTESDSCLHRPKTASALVYLMEELGDARMRCDQLVKYTAEAAKLIENSSHRDHFFEVAGHLIQGIPHTVFLLQKALQATALAATRLDYEEIKQDLRPEKVNELERALQDVRVRQVQRRSEPWMQEQVPMSNEGTVNEKTAMDWKVSNAKTAEMPDPDAPPVFGVDMVHQGLDKIVTSAKQAQIAMQAGQSKKMFFRLLGVLDGLGMVGRAYDLPDVGFLMRVWKTFAKMAGARPTTNFSASEEEKSSKFEEGKPADPTENMSPEDAKKWKVEHEKHKDNFKAAGEAEDAAKRSRFEKGKPADPTENMSPEDAKRWKVEHEKHKDNFKSAGTYKSIDEAQKGDKVEFTYKGEKVHGKVVRVKKDGTLTVDVEDHSDEDVGWVDIKPSKKAASEYSYGR